MSSTTGVICALRMNMKKKRKKKKKKKKKKNWPNYHKNNISVYIVCHSFSNTETCRQVEERISKEEIW